MVFMGDLTKLVPITNSFFSRYTLSSQYSTHCLFLV